MHNHAGRALRTDIQGMRAVAVAMVVVYHLHAPLLPGGFVGVDVFFVISGFLITAHLLGRPPARFGDLADFWGRRIRRLLPAINAGRSVLLYGPPGNGKTTLSTRIAGLFENPVYIPYAVEAAGQIIKVFWRSKPIFIFHRAKKDIEFADKVDWHTLPDPEPDTERVKKGHEQWLVVIGICTHLGCIPLAHQGNYDGWFCPCHGSQYDSAGRIRQGPAPKNLALPPYKFVSNDKIQIG